MKKAVVLCALVGVAVWAATAWSASSASDPTVQRLVKDVATLKAQVKTLQKQQKTLTKGVNGVGDVALASLLFGVCSDEIAADAFEGTWQEVDQLSAALQSGKTYFGPQTPVSATVGGQDVCAGGSVTRSQVLPPTVAQYQALLAPFHSASFRAAALTALSRRFHLK